MLLLCESNVFSLLYFMPINHHVRTFEEVFSPESLEAIYEKKIVSGRGGGRDHLSPEKFGLLYPEGFNLISEQCISNVYTFSPYKETLCQKGRGKVPRVLSIPTVRDKIVLSALTNLLQ